MGLYRSAQAVAGASGDGPIDWAAVGAAAKSSTEPGSLALSAADRRGYERDVGDARDRVRSVAGVDFDLPETVEIQNRHHWIDANVATFERVMAPLEDHVGLFPGVARVANTATMSVMLSYLSRNVLGQYDPLLLAEGDPTHSLYFVHPNIERVASVLNVDEPRFRRWIAFHEVSHAAEFGTAPWLSAHLEDAMADAVEGLAEGRLERDALSALDVTMTAVEGYAELLMDRAFDEEYDDLRRKLDERRASGGPLTKLIRRLLGLGMKRRQYERGKAFFDAVAAERGVAGASLVWEQPENLPTDEELDEPATWLARVN